MLVSAAAGAVGTMVGQIAKLAGCRVVGTAGGQDKCDWLVRELGFDAAVDYKAGGVRRALAAVCPGGVDVYFDNTGGPVLDAALSLMNLRGRIVCCGNVSQYDVEKPARTDGGAWPDRHQATEDGGLHRRVMDFFDRRASAAEAPWQAVGRRGPPQGHRRHRRWAREAPQALIGLFEGNNRGKAGGQDLRMFPPVTG